MKLPPYETCKDCRHGTFTVFTDDEFVGRSFKHYGEYSVEECIVIERILKPGNTVVEVGSNIGAHTIVIAKAVGPTGKVIAFEPQPQTAQLLRMNIVDNGVSDWVEVREQCAGDVARRAYIPKLEDLGHKNFGRVEIADDGSVGNTDVITIDSLDLKACRLIKIDAEGSELDALRGAIKTINKFRPFIYVENDREQKSEALIAFLIGLNYRPWWHRAPLFNILNARSNPRNVFGPIVSLMMFCAPEEMGVEVDQLDDVADIRHDDQMFTREIARYRRYIEINPNDLQARAYVAHLESMMRNMDSARELIAENKRRNPDHVPTKVIEGMWDLQAQKWPQSWDAYELRYQIPKPRNFGGHRKFPVPKWNGEETDKRVLFWNEQGFGDTVMFARFFKWARMRAPNAILEVPPELYELFQESGFAPGRLYRAGRSLPEFDLHCSIPSIPAAIRATDLQCEIGGPYLFPDKLLVAKWIDRRNPKVGICNVGSPRSERPFTRDLPAEFVDMIGKRHGPFLNLVQEGQFESFADTAAAISTLDLVISVDTSVAHLAGAMGKPVWLLLSFDPDWRWGLEGSASIWYPSMRIFRQPRFRDWASVMQEVEQALSDRIASAAA